MCNITVITSPGRAGTSFLVALFTLLKLPTGFTEKHVNSTIYHTAAHAGLESSLKIHNNTILCNSKRQIFKNPILLNGNLNWLNSANLKNIIIPLRNSEYAAKSREYQSIYHDRRRGGWSYGGIGNLTSQIIFNGQLLLENKWTSWHKYCTTFVSKSRTKSGLCIFKTKKVSGPVQYFSRDIFDSAQKTITNWICTWNICIKMKFVRRIFL